MTDLIFGPVKNLSSALWSNMADLADKIDDLICSFEGGGDSTMDTIAMLVFGWTVLALILVAIGKYVYARFLVKGAAAGDSVKVSSETVVKKPDSPVAEPSVEVKAEAVVNAAPAPKSSASRGGGKFVPPTPPLRKRLSAKKGSGPTPIAPKAVSLVPPPTSTGPDTEAVRWVNDIFIWLYSDLVILNELVNVWIQNLNNSAKNSVAEHGVGVEVVRLLPETHPPLVSNVFCECASNDDITITCDVDATPALQVKALRQKGEKVEVSHYRLNVNRFRGRLTTVCVTEKLLADVKCVGWPEVKVALAPVGSIKNNLDEQSLQNVICDILVTAMRATDVHLNLQQYPTCPRFSRYTPPPAHFLPVHYDSLAEEMTSRSRQQQYQEPDKLLDRRLLVKVVQAKGLMDCQDPYCVVEMDEPAQKNLTCVKKGSNSPVWDEHFLFDVNAKSGELLLEVHDRSTKKFLGLAIVGMEELLVNPSQRQTMSLQPRPYENDQVSGTLTVEFMFIEGADVPLQGKPYKLKETLRSVTPSGNVVTTSKTVYSAPNDRNVSNGGENVADSALRELELRNNQSAANKTTLIIHSVQRHASLRGDAPRLKVQKSETGTWHEVTSTEQGMTDGSPSFDVSGSTPVSDEERGRSRRRKRDFFGTIKRRLGKSRNRSKSAGPEERPEEEDPLSRSISADRVRDSSAHSTGFVVPSLRVTDGDLSRRSSISDLSGVSGASTRTYVNEASTLVLETLENGIKKHYLIPLSLAQKSKWRKRGTKLHIFNDHTFIAKHMSANTTCQICATLIPRRFGKQGYECRDCLIKCHKACHIKADHICPESTIHNIELNKLVKLPDPTRKFLPPLPPRKTSKVGEK